MNDILFGQIVTAIAGFDRLDLLRCVGALQLHPRNLTHTIRLELLAHAIASEAPKAGLPSATLKQLGSLCDGPPIGSLEVTRYEDPPEFMFAEPLTWRGHTHVVLPGISDDSAFGIRHLALALDEGNPSLGANALLDAARCIESVLVLSDEIMRRSGFGRWVEPEVTVDDVTYLPSSEDLIRFKSAVSFTDKELDVLLRNSGGLGSITSLISELGSRPKGYIPRKGLLIGRPIVRHGDEFVVALPGMLLESVRFDLLSRANASSRLAELGARYCKAIWTTADASLRRFGMSLFFDGGPFDLKTIPNSGEAIYRHDVDKFTQVMLVTDPFASFDRGAVFGDWNLQALQATIGARLNEIAKKFLERHLGAELLTLLVIQGAGRSHHIALNEAPGAFLAIRAAELEQISYVEGGESLALWKYAKAKERAHSRALIHSTSQLDEFELYRAHRHTYYISDEQFPDLLSVEVGTGVAIRKKVADRYDPHDVPTGLDGVSTSVARILDEGIPVYADLGRVGKRAAIYVDGFALRVWIVGPEYVADIRHRSLHGPYAQISQGIGYWLWQFSPSLAKSIDTLAKTASQLTIRLSLDLDLLDRAAQQQDRPPFVVTSQVAGLDVQISASAIPLFTTTDNRGERELMRSLLEGLQGVGGITELTSDVITAMVDRHAPLGHKKQFFFLNIDKTPALDEIDLPGVRTLQEADVEGVLDDLGEHLRLSEGVPLGPVKDDLRHPVLNKVVAFFYSLFSEEVSKLDPDGLIEQLIVRHESLIHDATLRGLTIATRLACFGDSPQMLATLREEMPRLARTKIASRFLIEYVSSKPPTGDRPLSLATYDRLIAVAHQITNFGFSSDLLHFKLANTGLAILPSGRLGIERDDFQEGLKAFLGAVSDDVIARSTRNFEKYWRQAGEENASTTLADLEEGTRAEFGASLAEYFDLMTAALEIPRMKRDSVGAVAKTELIDSLRATLGWQANKIDLMLDRLTLSSRDDFLKPPAPFSPADVYPWKFSREVSYLRRPFVLVTRNGTPTMCWGFRHMFEAAGYLGAICASGRFVAKTPEMRSVVSNLNDRRGRRFNDIVADSLEQHERLDVRRRVKKVGRFELPNDLGDIDVLCVDPTKRIVTAIECKDLALARTPEELSNQLDALVEHAPGASPKAVKRHSRRIDWLTRHIGAVLAECGVEGDGWRMTGMFVVDEPLFVPYLRDIGIEVVALESLLRRFSQ